MNLEQIKQALADAREGYDRAVDRKTLRFYRKRIDELEIQLHLAEVEGALT